MHSKRAEPPHKRKMSVQKYDVSINVHSVRAHDICHLEYLSCIENGNYMRIHLQVTAIRFSSNFKRKFKYYRLAAIIRHQPYRLPDIHIDLELISPRQQHAHSANGGAHIGSNWFSWKLPQVTMTIAWTKQTNGAKCHEKCMPLTPGLFTFFSISLWAKLIEWRAHTGYTLLDERCEIICLYECACLLPVAKIACSCWRKWSVQHNASNGNVCIEHDSLIC